VYGYPHPEGTNPLAYLGRWPGDCDEAAGRPRYKWPPGFEKSRVVYGVREALAGTEGKPLIVVEGVFDVYHLVQSGYPNTVALFGSMLSEAQADILASTGRGIILMLDGDPAGQTGTQQAFAKLLPRRCPQLSVVTLAEKEEPDRLPAEQLHRYLAFLSTPSLKGEHACP
jgi:DNA primase